LEDYQEREGGEGGGLLGLKRMDIKIFYQGGLRSDELLAPHKAHGISKIWVLLTIYTVEMS
jgi:hypothetical protein